MASLPSLSSLSSGFDAPKFLAPNSALSHGLREGGSMHEKKVLCDAREGLSASSAD